MIGLSVTRDSMEREGCCESWRNESIVCLGNSGTTSRRDDLQDGCLHVYLQFVHMIA